MQKTKTRRFLVALVIFSMVTTYLTMPTAKAASFDSAKDTISDSAPSIVTTHTITVNLGTALVAGDYISIDFGSFTGAVEGNTSCAAFGGSTASTTADGVGCVVNTTVASTSDQTITVTGVTSPAAGGYSVYARTYNSSGVEIENAQMIVYLVDAVTVTAHVNATLTFGVAPVNNGVLVNGIETTATSTATAVPFGTLSHLQPSVVGQELSVTTNASAGFSVTVQQDGEMVSAAGANINSFKMATNGNGLATPEAWSDPVATLGLDNTYGHLGLTTDDSDLSAGAFTSSKLAGLAGTAPMEIMSHNGAADGSTPDKGKVRVAYEVGITELQEAGDYQSTLTYVCTPTY